MRIGLAILNFGPDMQYDVKNDDGIPVAPPYNGHANGIDENRDGILDNVPQSKDVPLPLTFRAGIAFEAAADSNLEDHHFRRINSSFRQRREIQFRRRILVP